VRAMQLTVNGKPRDTQGAGTIKDFLEANGVNPALVAVEHNGEIIRRDRFDDVALAEGDQLEIIHMVGGGES
jgi:thiamine biosynthesis protein ThiS